MSLFYPLKWKINLQTILSLGAGRVTTFFFSVLKVRSGYDGGHAYHTRCVPALLMSTHGSSGLHGVAAVMGPSKPVRKPRHREGK